MWYISYWFWPVFSAFVWLAMLITMLVVWSTEGSPRYPSMEQGQHIAYISDIGAQGLKPLFIAMSAVTVVSFDIVFIMERWLRHTGRLARNTSVWQKLESLASCIAAIAGAAGLILLSIFDTLHHPHLHDVFLVLFIAGYLVSAIFICWEYQRLGFHFRKSSVLRYSFWIKLAFIIIEFALAIAFGVCGNQKKYNVGAVLEWTIAFIYFFYVLSFFIDFLPAVRTKHHQSHETEMDMAMENGDGAANGDRYYRGNTINGYNNGYTNGHTNGHTNGYTNGNTNGYTNGTTNGYTNGHANHPRYGHTNEELGEAYNKPVAPVPASRNF